MKVFIINGGQKFNGQGGLFNKTVVGWTVDFLEENNIEYQVTDINDKIDPQTEVEKYLWADLIIYQFPIWWFQVPHCLKWYFDEVLTMGIGSLSRNDGRSSANPDQNYGRGGLLQGKKYMINTTWNAPKAAFTAENDFFKQISEDDGVLFGLHKMNEYMSLEKLQGFHFHDVIKNATEQRIKNYHSEYVKHLQKALF